MLRTDHPNKLSFKSDLERVQALEVRQHYQNLALRALYYQVSDELLKDYCFDIQTFEAENHIEAN